MGLKFVPEQDKNGIHPSKMVEGKLYYILEWACLDGVRNNIVMVQDGKLRTIGWPSCYSGNSVDVLPDTFRVIQVPQGASLKLE